MYTHVWMRALPIFHAVPLCVFKIEGSCVYAEAQGPRCTALLRTWAPARSEERPLILAKSNKSSAL